MSFSPAAMQTNAQASIVLTFFLTSDFNANCADGYYAIHGFESKALI